MCACDCRQPTSFTGVTHAFIDLAKFKPQVNTRVSMRMHCFYMDLGHPVASVFFIHHHHIVLRPFFRDHSSEAVPEKNFSTLWCKGRLTEADTSTIRLGATPSGLTSAHLHYSPIFYGPDALPATEPTVSKH